MIVFDLIWHTLGLLSTKRSLPRAHIVLWLKNKFSAHLPDLDDDPRLQQIVKSIMVHGLCGEHNPTAPCIIRNSRTRKDLNVRKAFPNHI